MDISWNWLREYVDPGANPDSVVEQLTMSGLNHESTTAVGNDWCIDLEVTSNRPDCLGHLGIAREVAVLTDRPLRMPSVDLSRDDDREIEKYCQVTVEASHLCRRYTARLVRGVRVGPSPQWLAQRLKTIGIEPINNIVDISNYVMMECGQPLHTFDFAKLRGNRIVVREPKQGEQMVAINHQTYTFEPGMCVIADAERPVAIGGVMGGAETEISPSTRDVLIEAAWFVPGSIRGTARQLNLHSDSSFRFERGVDIEAVPWAGARCAQLIVELAGGELVPGQIDVKFGFPERHPIEFRFAGITRNLGIEIPRDIVVKILRGLGVEVLDHDRQRCRCLAPSWRRDLTREIDLVEEVGRIYGYDKVPDNVAVPMTSSYKPQGIRVLEKVRDVVRAAGFDEAMSPSLIPEAWSSACSPWTDRQPLVSQQPMLGVLEKGSQNLGPVQYLRRTLMASLLEAKRINEYRANDEIDLFEIAHVYLPQEQGLPLEPLMLGIVSGRSYVDVKGVIENVCREIDPAISLDFSPTDLMIFDQSHSATISADGKVVGYVGAISPGGKKTFGLRQPTTAAELDLTALSQRAVLIRRFSPLSEFPAVTRDLNFIVAEEVLWKQLEATVRVSSGALLESIQYRETFRDPNRDGPGKKRVLLSLTLRSRESTLSGAQVDDVCRSVIEACQSQVGASLVS